MAQGHMYGGTQSGSNPLLMVIHINSLGITPHRGARTRVAFNELKLANLLAWVVIKTIIITFVPTRLIKIHVYFSLFFTSFL